MPEEKEIKEEEVGEVGVGQVIEERELASLSINK